MDSLKDNLNNNESNKFNNDLFPNFENLSEGTLRRYQAYFNLRTENGGIAKPKNELINLVKDHFNKFEVDNDIVIENFIRIEKDQTNEKNNSIRKSLRIQEKGIAKFLDNFNAKS
jgi:hypothetical protein